MSKLLETLKSEHEQLAAALGHLKEWGIASQEGKDLLVAAKVALLDHLKKEDEELYPKLFKAAESDPQLESTLKMLAKDMATISTKALTFFEKYIGSDNDTSFALDLGDLIISLTSRIKREEEILYNKYDQLEE